MSVSVGLFKVNTHLSDLITGAGSVVASVLDDCKACCARALNS